MCASCQYQDAVDAIESHLVQSPYAPFAAELLTLRRGILDLEHCGDAIAFRLEDIDQQVRGTG